MDVWVVIRKGLVYRRASVRVKGLRQGGEDAGLASKLRFELGDAGADEGDFGSVLKSAFGIFRRGEGFKAEEFGFEAGAFGREKFDGLLGFEKATRSPAGFVGDLGGRERARDGGALSGMIPGSVVLAAEEAVLCVGTMDDVFVHIAMVCA